MEPYYYTKPEFQKFINYHQLLPNSDEDWGIQDLSKKSEVTRLITPGMVVFKEPSDTVKDTTPHNYPLGDSTFFKKHLDLYINFQKKMVVDKISKINYSAQKSVEIADDLYLKYRSQIMNIQQNNIYEDLVNSNIGEWEALWDEVDSNEFPFDLNTYELRNKINPKLIVNTIFESIAKFLMFPPIIATSLNSKIKLEAKSFVESKYYNLKFIHQYMTLKKLSNLNYLNIDYFGVTYTTDEYLETSDDIIKSLDNIGGSKYVYNDTYLKRSHQLVDTPNTTNEFVVFASHSRLNGRDSLTQARDWLRVYDTSNMYAYLAYRNTQGDWAESLKSQYTKHDSINKTLNEIINPQYVTQGLFEINLDSIFVNADDDWAGVCYSNMKYYRKNPDNSWNIYEVCPMNVIDADNIYGGFGSLSDIDTLRYIIKYESTIEKIKEINHLGFFYKATNRDGDYYNFKCHFKYITHYLYNELEIFPHDTWTEIGLNSFPFYGADPYFYSTNSSGVIMSYISWNTPTQTINWPKTNPLNIK